MNPRDGRLSRPSRYGTLAVATALVVGTPSAAAAYPSVPLQAAIDYSIDVSGPNRFIGVEAIDGQSAWAVGGQGTAATPEEKSLVAHWNGEKWSLVESPSPVPLSGVSGSGRSDVWAVGSSADGSTSAIQHWDGVAWQAVPHVAGSASHPVTLAGVTAADATTAIAVGYGGPLEMGQPHAQHWNGTTWQEQRVPMPENALMAVLSAVDNAGPREAFASGFAVSGQGELLPFIVRWDGAQWSLVEAPTSVGGGYTDILALGGNKFVAVGAALSPADGSPVPALVSYDNGSWIPENLPVTSGELNGVSVDAKGTLWVVGDRLGKAGHDDRHPLVLRRQASGGDWSTPITPSLEIGGLRDVAAVPGRSEAWTVGASGITDADHQNFIFGFWR